MNRKPKVSFLEDYSEEEQEKLGNKSRNNHQTILNDENAGNVLTRKLSRTRTISSILGSLDNLLDSSPSETNWSRNRLRNQELELERKMTWKDKGKGREVITPFPVLNVSTDKSASLEKLRRTIGERLYEDVQNSGVNSIGSSSRSPINLSINPQSNEAFYPIQSTPYNNLLNSTRPSAPLNLPSTSSTHESNGSNSNITSSNISTPTDILRSNAPSPESKLSSPTPIEPRIFFRRPSLLSRTTLPISPPTSPLSPITPNIVLSPTSTRSNLPRLSTLGLPAIKHLLLRKSGFIEILEGNGDLVIDLSLSDRIRSVSSIRISGDGDKIWTRIREREDSKIVMESYDCDNLPVELEKYYSLAFKFVQAVRGKVKKIIIFTRHPSPSTKQIIYSDNPPSFEITFYHSESNDQSSFNSPNLSIRISRISNIISITRPFISTSTSTSPLRKLSFPLDKYLSCPFSIISLTRIERIQIDWSIDQIKSIDIIVRDLDKLPFVGELNLVVDEEKILGSTSNNERKEERKKKEMNPTEELLTLLRGFEEDNDTDAKKMVENQVESRKEDRQYLKGAGWILRTRLISSSSPTTCTWYRILLTDGTELEIDEVNKVIRWKGEWFSLINWNELGFDFGRGRRRELPIRVRRVLGIVSEMIELF